MMRTGQCMCGAVVYAADTEDTFGACYCKMCQRWSAGQYAGVHAHGLGFTKGAEHVTEFKSSDWAARGFCNVCGTSLYYRTEGADTHSVAIGTLDTLDGLTCAREYFVDQKPTALSFPDNTDTMTSAEIYKKWGPAIEAAKDVGASHE